MCVCVWTSQTLHPDSNGETVKRRSPVCGFTTIRERGQLQRVSIFLNLIRALSR